MPEAECIICGDGFWRKYREDTCSAACKEKKGKKRIRSTMAIREQIRIGDTIDYWWSRKIHRGVVKRLSSKRWRVDVETQGETFHIRIDDVWAITAASSDSYKNDDRHDKDVKYDDEKR